MVVSGVEEGPGGGLVRGWLLEGVLIRVAVRRCRMCCMMLVAGGSFVLALSCGAVGWRLWGSLLVCVSMWFPRAFVGTDVWLGLRDVVGTA